MWNCPQSWFHHHHHPQNSTGSRARARKGNFLPLLEALLKLSTDFPMTLFLGTFQCSTAKWAWTNVCKKMRKEKVNRMMRKGKKEERETCMCVCTRVHTMTFMLVFIEVVTWFAGTAVSSDVIMTKMWTHHNVFPAFINIWWQRSKVNARHKYWDTCWSSCGKQQIFEQTLEQP